MAGIAIPDNLRPALTAVVKYHFWILAALAPLLLMPPLFIGTGSLRSKIAAQRAQIEAKIGQARAVTALKPHPNEKWLAKIDADTEAVSRETIDEWRRFWHSQQALRVWPRELGDPFLNAIATLKPGGQLDRQSRLEYEQRAPRLVQGLPARMGVENKMLEAPAGAAGAPRPATQQVSGRGPVLTWNPESQQRLYNGFIWKRTEPPSTTQILLLQENIWVYGLFCDRLGGFVQKSGATGAHDSPLTFVDELKVGFAAISQTGGGRGPRITVPKAAGPGAPEAAAMPEPQPGADAGGQPLWNPLFSVDAGGPRADAAPIDQPGGPAPDPNRNFIYVDFTGKPLSAADLDATKAMQMVHLVPFVLRVTIDQRQLDRLLVALATSPIPIDVREVRVNPDGVRAPAATGITVPGSITMRPNDLSVELRGTVALATRPPAAADAQPSPEAAP